MEFFQKCSSMLSASGLFEGAVESRGNMTFISKEKMEKRQRKAAKAELKKKVLEARRSDTEACSAESSAAAGSISEKLNRAKSSTAPAEQAPIPTQSTLPVDISFVVPSEPGPDLDLDQAALCFQGLLEEIEEACKGPETTQKASSFASGGVRPRQPEECPEASCSEDDQETSQVCPEQDRPQDIDALAMKACRPGSGQGRMLVVVAGPHGSLPVAVPKWAKPGTLVRVRIGPKVAFRAVVPDGLKGGDVMALELPSGERMQVPVPLDKMTGDEFDISPPVIMVQVPEGATPGSVVEYTDSDGKKCKATVPKAVPVGQYFEVPLVQPDFL
eukprot:gb/GFBE01058468.1/.p1 GENE.gb/GFBE01058468.1/~~gb/GFBE01058468.1/.p1  ORF type:complete len:330 (+),score=80.48 gb/GFBE01058468.1/:1-990(+)